MSTEFLSDSLHILGMRAYKLEMGLGPTRAYFFKIFDPGRVLFLLLGLCKVGSATSGSGKLVSTIIPKFFNFFPFGQKISHWVRSKNTRVKSGLAPQKYDWVGASYGFRSKFLAWVGSIFLLGSGRVSHLWFWFRFGDKFPQKISNFSIFPLWVKKISSSHVKKYPGQRQVGLLFTTGQKYAWVGSWPISSWGTLI